MNSSKKAVFLDRDGIINVDHGYVYTIANFELTDGIIELCNHLQRMGYLLIVVTNQSGIGRGYYTREDFEIVTNYMVEQFKTQNVDLAKVYHCPHTPEERCACRKPNAGMIVKAKEELGIDIGSSWIIGDKESDIDAGLNANIQNTILVGNRDQATKAKYVVDKISDILSIIRG